MCVQLHEIEDLGVKARILQIQAIQQWLPLDKLPQGNFPLQSIGSLFQLYTDLGRSKRGNSPMEREEGKRDKKCHFPLSSQKDTTDKNKQKAKLPIKKVFLKEISHTHAAGSFSNKFQLSPLSSSYKPNLEVRNVRDF